MGEFVWPGAWLTAGGRTDDISFDIVAETCNIVARNSNDVEATFDFVEKIVQFVAFDNVALTLLLVWSGACGLAIYPYFFLV